MHRKKRFSVEIYNPNGPNFKVPTRKYKTPNYNTISTIMNLAQTFLIILLFIKIKVV